MIAIPDDDDFEDYDPDDYDEYEAALGECGQMNDGFCLLVGSEYCDWECPFRDELYGNEPIARPAWQEDPDED